MSAQHNHALRLTGKFLVITATLLLIRFLDDPFRDGIGGLQPVAMERTQRILDGQRQIFGDTGALPCDTNGRPLR